MSRKRPLVRFDSRLRTVSYFSLQSYYTWNPSTRTAKPRAARNEGVSPRRKNKRSFLVWSQSLILTRSPSNLMGSCCNITSWFAIALAEIRTRRILEKRGTASSLIWLFLVADGGCFECNCWAPWNPSRWRCGIPRCTSLFLVQIVDCGRGKLTRKKKGDYCRVRFNSLPTIRTLRPTCWTLEQVGEDFLELYFAVCRWVFETPCLSHSEMNLRLCSRQYW